MLNFSINISIYFPGNSFSVHWTKRYRDDHHKKQEFQVTIYADGSMVFLYKNLFQELIQLSQAVGYPLTIGLQEGFAAEDVTNPEGKDNFCTLFS